MINVKVDEAAAFDMLSILNIKSNRSSISAKQFIDALDNISSQIGLDKTNTILESEIYNKLLNANKKVFEYIDIMNADEYIIPASTVHAANMERYRYKNEMQKLYFSSNLSEEKI